MLDPTEAMAGLAGCVDPLLFGVRHHSPACAAAVGPCLDAFGPDRLLIELPAEFSDWIGWLGHREAKAPLALAAVVEGMGTSFYPFADFSPELAAIRWALGRGVPVEAFDLPIGARDEVALPEDEGEELESASGLVGKLLAQTGAEDSEELWDRMVEGPGVGGRPEAVRRAALLYGWALRADSGPKTRTVDLAREAFMRSRLDAVRKDGAKRIAVVVGAFHGAALGPKELDPVGRTDKFPKVTKSAKPPVLSLVTYGFDLFDSRSGYPAGIKDPLWQQRAFGCAVEGVPTERAVAECLVEICRDVRKARHVAGIPDATEALRMARELATMRGLPGPGRRELLEAVTTALGRGEILGRGRVLARAMERVLVGRERGRLAPDTPRTGLFPYVLRLLAALKLPGPDDRTPVDLLRLDPLRSELDRRRHVALHRTIAAGVSYAELVEGDTAGDDDALTHTWKLDWEPSTEATVELAGLYGVTLEGAAEGAVRAAIHRLERDEKLTPGARLAALGTAAECGLGRVVAEGLVALTGPFVHEARLTEIVDAYALVDRIDRGHVPGLPSPAQERSFKPEDIGSIPSFTLPAEAGVSRVRAELLAAGVRAVEGLLGSDDPVDARSLFELVRLMNGDVTVGEGRLVWALDRLATEGAPLMVGAASAARLLIGRDTGEGLGETMASWLDATPDPDGQRGLARRLHGSLLLIGGLMEAHPRLLGALSARIETMADEDFLRVLPSVRHGFDALSPAARGRLLVELGERFGDAQPLDVALELNPAEMAAFAAADAAGRDALSRLGFLIDNAAIGASEGDRRAVPTDRALSPRDRWRLVLGREREQLPPQHQRYARALDEMYGQGHGEGSRSDLGGQGGQGGGQERSFPTVREWADEVQDLFGEGVRVEVLGRAAEMGNAHALLLLDPDAVTPSITLLEQALSLKGGMSESQLATLRRICRRITDELVKKLATQVRPALSGVSVPRRSHRRTDRLDLRRTIEVNLRTLQAGEDGRPKLVPDRFLYKSRARREMDWEVQLVVDTSGSMEASVIHAAMMAAILASLPSVKVRFFAFSTEVIDFTDRVDDPLGLLLEVQVGGGTSIYKALRYAREQVVVPRKTMLVLISDFEEGGSVPAMLAEVRALVESGVRPLGLAALDDNAKPRFSEAIASQVVACGMPVAALTPVELARWVGEQIRGGTHG